MRMKVLLFVLLGVSLALGARPDSEYQAAFTQWMGKHGKSYHSSEFPHRYNIFKSNMDMVDEINKQGHSFTVGLTIFADMTLAEFTTVILTPQRAPPAADDNGPAHQETRTPRSASLDWRTKGAVTAIKNQGQCGSCWTFATTASIEAANQIATGVLTSLSESNILDCSGAGSCNGGYITGAYQYIINNGGIDTEASYPYTAAQGSCKYNSANTVAGLTSYQCVYTNDEAGLLNAVNLQPVAVTIQANLSTFQHYTGGTYNDVGCTAAGLDHNLLNIGYGTDANSVDYWLLKNQWGTGWGMQGYMQMKRGVNMCGIAAQAYYPSRQSTRGFVYQDYAFPGFSYWLYGSVGSFTPQGKGVTGFAISGVMATNSKINLQSSAAVSMSGFTNFVFTVYANTGCTMSFNLGSTSQSSSMTSSWKTITTPLTSLGSLSSVTNIYFTNTGGSCTYWFDNIKFA